MPARWIDDEELCGDDYGGGTAGPGRSFIKSKMEREQVEPVILPPVEADLGHDA